MNVTMLQLGSISSSLNSSKTSMKTGDLKNDFFNLLQTQTRSIDQNDSQPLALNADILKELVQFLKEGISVTGNLGFTNKPKISDEQISNLLGMSQDDWKEKLKDLTDSLLGLFASIPQLLTQVKNITEDLNQGNFIQGFAQLMSAFSKLPADSIPQLKGDQLQTLAKNVKAVEMLAKTVDLSLGDIKQLTQLNDSVKHVIAKMEQLIHDNKMQTRNTILQTSFKSVLNDSKNISVGVSEVKDTDTPNPTNLIGNIMNPISKTEQFIIHVGKETPANYSQFVKDFTNILAKAQLTTNIDGTSKLFIKLYPEHLGSVRIELLQDNGSITAKMFASSGAAKDLLDSQLNHLKDAFSMQNIQVDKIDVVYGQTETQKFGQSDPRQQSFNQERKAPEQQKEDENETQFSNLLNESLLEKIV